MRRVLKVIALAAPGREVARHARHQRLSPGRAEAADMSASPPAPVPREDTLRYAFSLYSDEEVHAVWTYLQSRRALSLCKRSRRSRKK